jgi:hypothetical protein
MWWWSSSLRVTAILNRDRERRRSAPLLTPAPTDLRLNKKHTHPSSHNSQHHNSVLQPPTSVFMLFPHRRKSCYLYLYLHATTRHDIYFYTLAGRTSSPYFSTSSRNTTRPTRHFYQKQTAVIRTTTTDPPLYRRVAGRSRPAKPITGGSPHSHLFLSDILHTTRRPAISKHEC